MKNTKAVQININPVSPAFIKYSSILFYTKKDAKRNLLSFDAFVELIIADLLLHCKHFFEKNYFFCATAIPLLFQSLDSITSSLPPENEICASSSTISLLIPRELNPPMV